MLLLSRLHWLLLQFELLRLLAAKLLTAELHRPDRLSAGCSLLSGARFCISGHSWLQLLVFVYSNNEHESVF